MATKTIGPLGGAWTTDATWVEGTKPTAADDVVATALSGSVTIGAGSVCRSIDLTGYVGTITHTAAVAFAIGDGTAGASNNALIFPSSGWTYTLGNAATSSLSFVSTSATQQTINTGGKAVGNVVFNGVAGSWILGANLTGTGSLTITNGTLDAGSNYQINLSVSFSTGAGGTFVCRAGKIILAGAGVLTTNGSNLFDVELAGVAAGLSIGGTTVTITGTLTIGASRTFVSQNGTLVMTGAAFINFGNLQLFGADTLTGFTNDVSNGGTVTYIGTAANTYTGLVAGNSYANLTFNGATRTWKPTATTTVSGNLTLTNGTFDLNGQTVNVGGNWVKTSGTFTHSNGTVTLTDAPHTISGSSTFYDLTMTVAAARTLTFTDGTTQTVEHALTLQGASGQLLTLAGSSTGGWTIAVPATQTLSFLSVSRSTATGTTAAAGATSTDGGNNVNWTFSSGGGQTRATDGKSF